jgi:Skp family chaperone for outer membrane proteins
VAKEHNFAYVFDVQTLLYYEKGEDITDLVKKKLGIK